MLLPIIDDRNETVFLENIEPGAFLWWNEYLCRRLKDGVRGQTVFNSYYEIPVEIMSSGEVISMDPKKLVEPIKCELHIVEE